MSGAPSNRLESIQALRGIAALMVFFFHLVVTVDRYTPANLRQWVEFGNFGVDLFFVISGFVMAHSVRNLSGHGDAVGFITRRVWRIAPLLYFLTLAQIGLTSLWGGHYGYARIVNCFTIIPVFRAPHEMQYALIPAWTLGFEMVFYLLVAGAVALRIRALWAAIPLLLLPLMPGPFGSSLMIEFVYGLAAYWLWTKGLVPNPLSMVVGAALLLLFPLPGERFIYWGIPAAMVFLAALSWSPVETKAGKPLLWLGAISYSMYLSHVVAFDHMGVIASPLGPWVVAVILPPFGLLVAWLVYEAIEAPLQRMKIYERGKAEVGGVKSAV